MKHHPNARFAPLRTGTPMSVEPTGGYHEGGRRVLDQTREFRAPIEDVWAAVTEPDRLARWIGSWAGDPESGRVQFLMLFEGATSARTWRSGSASRRALLHVTSHVGDEVLLDLDLC